MRGTRESFLSLRQLARPGARQKVLNLLESVVFQDELAKVGEVTITITVTGEAPVSQTINATLSDHEERIRALEP